MQISYRILRPDFALGAVFVGLLALIWGIVGVMTLATILTLGAFFALLRIFSDTLTIRSGYITLRTPPFYNHAYDFSEIEKVVCVGHKITFHLPVALKYRGRNFQ